MTGLKVDLKKRLAKIIQQEKVSIDRSLSTRSSQIFEEFQADEEKAEAAAKDETSAAANDEVVTASATVETKADVKEHTPADIEKLRKEIESKYQLPSHRSILVHPTSIKGDKFDCRIVSLHYLLNYANKDTIKEKCFEVKPPLL